MMLKRIIKTIALPLSLVLLSACSEDNGEDDIPNAFLDTQPLFNTVLLENGHYYRTSELQHAGIYPTLKTYEPLSDLYGCNILFINRDGEVEQNICSMDRLPLIGQVFRGDPEIRNPDSPTVEEIMNRVVELDDWMAPRFELMLRQLPDDIRGMFSSVAVIFLLDDIQRSQYNRDSSAIYFNAKALTTGEIQPRGLSYRSPDWTENFLYSSSNNESGPDVIKFLDLLAPEEIFALIPVETLMTIPYRDLLQLMPEETFYQELSDQGITLEQMAEARLVTGVDFEKAQEDAIKDKNDLGSAVSYPADLTLSDITQEIPLETLVKMDLTSILETLPDDLIPARTKTALLSYYREQTLGDVLPVIPYDILDTYFDLDSRKKLMITQEANKDQLYAQLEIMRVLALANNYYPKAIVDQLRINNGQFDQETVEQLEIPSDITPVNTSFTALIQPVEEQGITLLNDRFPLTGAGTLEHLAYQYYSTGPVFPKQQDEDANYNPAREVSRSDIFGSSRLFDEEGNFLQTTFGLQDSISTAPGENRNPVLAESGLPLLQSPVDTVYAITAQDDHKSLDFNFYPVLPFLPAERSGLASLSAENAFDLFLSGNAISPRAYVSAEEDFGLLFEAAAALYYLDLLDETSFYAKDHYNDCRELTVAGGVRGRVLSGAVKERALAVFAHFFPEYESRLRSTINNLGDQELAFGKSICRF